LRDSGRARIIVGSRGRAGEEWAGISTMTSSQKIIFGMTPGTSPTVEINTTLYHRLELRGDWTARGAVG